MFTSSTSPQNRGGLTPNRGAGGGGGGGAGGPDTPWSLQRIMEACRAPKYFRSQAQLFEYIEQENTRRLKRAAGGAAASGRHHAGSRSTSAPATPLSSHNLNNNNNMNNFSSSSQRWSGGSGDLDLAAFNNGSFGALSAQQQTDMFGVGGVGNHRAAAAAAAGDVELLRPFCVSIDPSVAPQSAGFLSSTTQLPASSSTPSQMPRSGSSGSLSANNNNITSFFAAPNNEHRNRVAATEKNLLSMFNEAGRTGTSTLPQRRQQREEQSNTNTNSSASAAAVSTQQQHSPSTQQQQQQQQTRFFIPMTLTDYARVALGEEVPHAQQHFFEIIQDGAPCVLYFDVEMEPHMAMTSSEHQELKEQVHDILKQILPPQQQQQQQLSSSTQTTATSQQQSASSQLLCSTSTPPLSARGQPTTTTSSKDDAASILLLDSQQQTQPPPPTTTQQQREEERPYTITNTQRVKHRCCPVDCTAPPFNHELTRDVLIAELKRFANEVLSLPLDCSIETATTGGTGVASDPAVARLDDSCFFVLVSDSPVNVKFSQHYIVRFTDDTVRFAHNLDVKVFVTSFAHYLYERAVEDERVHSALFYHESPSRRKCTIPVKKTTSGNSNNNSFSSQPHLATISPRPRSSYGVAGGATATDVSPGVMARQNSNSEILNGSQTQQQSQLQQQMSQDVAQYAAYGYTEVDYTLPALGLKCIIDEAVYSRNRMMRCFGSCKLGKSAVLQFDNDWFSPGMGGDYCSLRFAQKPGGLIGATLISEPLCTGPLAQQRHQQQHQQQHLSSQQSQSTQRGGAVTQQQQQQQQPTQAAPPPPAYFAAAPRYKLIDSDALSQSSVALGNPALAARPNIGPAATTAPQTRSFVAGANNPSHAAFAQAHDSTNLNAAAALLKLPLLVREVCEAQAKLDRQVTAGSLSVESIQVHVPKVLSEDSGNNNSNNGDSPGRGGGQPPVTLTIKIRGSRFCHVVSRAHRSNGVFWVAKFYPTGGREGTGSTSIEQRCFDDECKGRHRHSVPCNAGTTVELKMYLKIGLVGSSWSATDRSECALSDAEIEARNKQAMASTRYMSVEAAAVVGQKHGIPELARMTAQRLRQEEEEKKTQLQQQQQPGQRQPLMMSFEERQQQYKAARTKFVPPSARGKQQQQQQQQQPGSATKENKQHHT